MTAQLSIQTQEALTEAGYEATVNPTTFRPTGFMRRDITEGLSTRITVRPGHLDKLFRITLEKWDERGTKQIDHTEIWHEDDLPATTEGRASFFKLIAKALAN